MRLLSGFESVRPRARRRPDLPPRPDDPRDLRPRRRPWRPRGPRASQGTRWPKRCHWRRRGGTTKENGRSGQKQNRTTARPAARRRGEVSGSLRTPLSAGGGPAGAALRVAISERPDRGRPLRTSHRGGRSEELVSLRDDGDDRPDPGLRDCLAPAQRRPRPRERTPHGPERLQSEVGATTTRALRTRRLLPEALRLPPHRHVPTSRGDLALLPRRRQLPHGVPLRLPRRRLPRGLSALRPRQSGVRGHATSLE
mmetsp:Transcript_5153/g.16896  ORF Transcript_5153/g.16896 Transcript_5153/m.16896 type:complete len:254 (+) Transcript_5153:336-1097(+)